MTTCFLKYTIDPDKVIQFEHYGKLWIDLVNEMGGLHHGYLLPHEGANNIAYASFSFPSLAEYENYRNRISHSPKCLEALQYAKDTKCIISFERNFLRPVFEGVSEKEKLFY
ncbi:MAG: NIPSNAP family protein [Flavobacteriaceae bacterium]|nr:MAG: NIPSNAP family protein [Flavobacteriaceae bacterium]